MSSGLDMPSGRMRGIAATHVLNRSILGFLSPLSKMEGDVKQHLFTKDVRKQDELNISTFPNSKYRWVMFAKANKDNYLSSFQDKINYYLCSHFCVSLSVAALCCNLRDHVLWFFVEHLDAGEHHATSHLLVQVSKDVVQSFPHLGVVQGHACGEQK